MQFHEVLFPQRLSYGTRGGPRFDTNVIMTRRGNEIREARTRNPIREYDVRCTTFNRDELIELYNFFMARKGSVFGFRFRDYLDYSTKINGRDIPGKDHPLYIYPDGTLQLQKLYEDGGYYHRRLIFKPIEGSVVIYSGDTVLVEGVDYTVNYENGVVTPINSLSGVMTGCLFDVPVNFAPDTDKFFQIVLEDYDIGNVQSLKLIEIKQLIQTLPSIDGPGTENYPGPGPGIAGGGGSDPDPLPGCVTCGGGSDPSPDYGSTPPPQEPPPVPILPGWYGVFNCETGEQVASRIFSSDISGSLPWYFRDGESGDCFYVTETSDVSQTEPDEGDKIVYAVSVEDCDDEGCDCLRCQACSNELCRETVTLKYTNNDSNKNFEIPLELTPSKLQWVGSDISGGQTRNVTLSCTHTGFGVIIVGSIVGGDYWSMATGAFCPIGTFDTHIGSPGSGSLGIASSNGGNLRLV
jgi:uncharacterized protein (TIGR02217 family)